jgi:hypothetical protein
VTRRYLLALTIATVCAAVPAAGQQAAARKVYDMGGVTVAIPFTVRVEKRRGPDFDLFYFRTPEKDPRGKPRHLLFTYVGFHPSFPQKRPKGTAEVREIVNGLAARTFRWKGKDGTDCRESLVHLGKNNRAHYVHFVYSDLTAAEARIAEEIIATVRSVP